MTVSVEQTVATLRARAAARRAAQQARGQVLLGRLTGAVQHEAPPGAEVWLIGSLAWGGFGEHSDVDLVVRGVDSGFASQLEVLLTRALEVPVEVLRAEELPASFRERVEREGVLLHGT